MPVGENIKLYRNSLGLTQKQLAEKCSISESAIKYYESNRRNPKIETLNKIASALGVTINDLTGPQKTVTQETIEMILEGGCTLEQLSTEINIPLEDLENMLNNKSFDLSNWKKFLEYIGATQEQISEAFIHDVYVNSVYNNKGEYEGANTLKKMFLGEALTLDEVLANVVEEDREFITHMYHAGAFNNMNAANNKAPSKIVKRNDLGDLDDIMKPINDFVKFMVSDGYPVSNLNNKTLQYLYTKVTEILEFEFYKLEKNDFILPDDKK